MELSAQIKNKKERVKPTESEETKKDLGSEIPESLDRVSVEEPLILEDLLKSFFAEDERDLSCEGCKRSDSKAKVRTHTRTYRHTDTDITHA